MQETSVFLHHNIAGAVPIGENALQGERYSKHSSRMRKARLPIVSRMSGVGWGWVTTPWTYPRTPERTYHPLWTKSENRCRHCSLFRVSFTVLSLKNLYSLCKNEVPFGVSVNQQIFIKTNQ